MTTREPDMAVRGAVFVAVVLALAWLIYAHEKNDPNCGGHKRCEVGHSMLAHGQCWCVTPPEDQ